jgi:hypothetical protein
MAMLSLGVFQGGLACVLPSVAVLIWGRCTIGSVRVIGPSELNGVYSLFARLVARVPLDSEEDVCGVWPLMTRKDS